MCKTILWSDSWSDSQSSSGVRVFMSSLRRHVRFRVCVCVLKENACLCHPFIHRYDRDLCVNAHHITLISGEWIESMIRCKETLSEHVYKYKNSAKLHYQRMWTDHSGEQISEGDFTAVPSTTCDSTAALLQTGTHILTLHRHFLSARYLSGLCFSGEHERNTEQSVTERLLGGAAYIFGSRKFSASLVKWTKRFFEAHHFASIIFCIRVTRGIVSALIPTDDIYLIHYLTGTIDSQKQPQN